VHQDRRESRSTLVPWGVIPHEGAFEMYGGGGVAGDQVAATEEAQEEEEEEEGW